MSPRTGSTKRPMAESCGSSTATCSTASSSVRLAGPRGDWVYELTLKLNGTKTHFAHGSACRIGACPSYLKLKVKRAVSYVSDFEQAVALEARHRGVHGVVCGHIHHAEVREIDGMLYANDGDWVESLTALVEHTDGRLEMSTGPSAKPASRRHSRRRSASKPLSRLLTARTSGPLSPYKAPACRDTPITSLIIKLIEPDSLRRAFECVATEDLFDDLARRLARRNSSIFIAVQVQSEAIDGDSLLGIHLDDSFDAISLPQAADAHQTPSGKIPCHGTVIERKQTAPKGLWK